MRTERVWPAGIMLGMSLVSATSGLAQQQALTVESLAPRVQVIRGHPGGNVLVLTAADRVLLVDAQSAGVADSLRAVLGTIADVPVGMVINSHYHEDHIGGNSAFRATADIVGHVNLSALAAVDSTIEELGWDKDPADADDLPTMSIAADTAIRFDDIAIDLLAFDDAHTGGDLAVYLPAANVLHTGDVLEVDAFPFVDWWGGGSLDGMIAAADRLLEVADDDTRIVPGHGHIVDRGHLTAYRHMLATLRDRVVDAIERGDDLETTMDAGYASEYAAGRGGERAARRFVGIVYLGLSTVR